MNEPVLEMTIMTKMVDGIEMYSVTYLYNTSPKMPSDVKYTIKDRIKNRNKVIDEITNDA